MIGLGEQMEIKVRKECKVCKAIEEHLGEVETECSACHGERVVEAWIPLDDLIAYALARLRVIQKMENDECPSHE